MLIDNKLFLDSPFKSEKFLIDIAAIESSVFAAKVYLILHCPGYADIAMLSSNTVAQLPSRKTQEPTLVPKIKASVYDLLVLMCLKSPRNDLMNVNI